MLCSVVLPTNITCRCCMCVDQCLLDQDGEPGTVEAIEEDSEVTAIAEVPSVVEPPVSLPTTQSKPSSQTLPQVRMHLDCPLPCLDTGVSVNTAY